MSYIRFTAQQFTEDQLVAVATAIATFCESKIVEDDDSDCTYYETELGQSYEFELVEDLDERVYLKIGGEEAGVPEVAHVHPQCSMGRLGITADDGEGAI